jgi:hypothetical protein
MFMKCYSSLHVSNVKPMQGHAPHEPARSASRVMAPIKSAEGSPSPHPKGAPGPSEQVQEDFLNTLSGLNVLPYGGESLTTTYHSFY